MHYCITNGGTAPNVVPDYASSIYQFRAMDNYNSAKELFERAVKVARGAALMTETEMAFKVLSVIPQFYYNLPLCQHMVQAAGKIPALDYTKEEMELARKH